MISPIAKKASYSTKGKLYWFHESCFNKIKNLNIAVMKYEERAMVHSIPEKVRHYPTGQAVAAIPKKCTIEEQFEFIVKAIQLCGPLSRKQLTVETNISYETLCWRVWCNIDPNHKKYGQDKQTPMFSIHEKKGFRGVELIDLTVK